MDPKPQVGLGMRLNTARHIVDAVYRSDPPCPRYVNPPAGDFDIPRSAARRIQGRFGAMARDGVPANPHAWLVSTVGSKPRRNSPAHPIRAVARRYRQATRDGYRRSGGVERRSIKTTRLRLIFT